MKTLPALILFLFATTGFAQNAANCIPANSSYVFALNLAQLKAKSAEMDYSKYLESLMPGNSSYGYEGFSNALCNYLDPAALMKHPDSFGIDIKSYLYVYKTSVKDVSGTVYLLNLSDADRFESRLNTICNGMDINYQKKSLAGGTFYLGPKTSVAINGKLAIVFVKSYSYFQDFAYETEADAGYDSAYTAEKQADNLRIDSLFYEQLNNGGETDYDAAVTRHQLKSDTSIAFRAKQRADAAKLEAVNEKYRNILALMESMLQAQQNNMLQNRNFAALNNGAHDAFIFMNTMAFMSNEYLNPFGSLYRFGVDEENRTTSGKTPRLTAGISSSYSIDFENGKARIQFLNTYNEHVYPYFKKAYGIKQDKQLLKYIDGENLLGYMSMAVSSKELAKFYEDFYIEMLEGMPKRKRDMNMLPAMQLAYAFLDKEMLYNTLDGRAILACTGFTDVRMKFSSYSYDDEFNKQEVTEERLVRQPRMVMAAAIGNRENAKKLFDIIGQFDVFVKVKENVIGYYGGRDVPFNLFICLTDDALIMSNDINVVVNPATYPKLPKEDLKQIMSHNIAMKIYSDRMMAGVRDAYFKGVDTMPWFAEIMNRLGNIEMTDTRPSKDSYGAMATVSLKDGSANALYQLLKMMQSADGF